MARECEICGKPAQRKRRHRCYACQRLFCWRCGDTYPSVSMVRPYVAKCWPCHEDQHEKNEKESNVSQQ